MLDDSAMSILRSLNLSSAVLCVLVLVLIFLFDSASLILMHGDLACKQVTSYANLCILTTRVLIVNVLQSSQIILEQRSKLDFKRPNSVLKTSIRSSTLIALHLPFIVVLAL